MMKIKFTEFAFAATLLFIFGGTTEGEYLDPTWGIVPLPVKARPSSTPTSETTPPKRQKARFTKGGLVGFPTPQSEPMTGPALTSPPGSIIVGGHWHHPNDFGAVLHRERSGSTGRLGVWLKPIQRVEKSKEKQ